MDELKLKLSTRVMRAIASKWLSRFLYEKTGIRVNVSIEDLKIDTVGSNLVFDVHAKGSVTEDEITRSMSLKLTQ